METSLKRLWTRQRAKGRSGDGPNFKQTPTYEVHVSGPPPQLGSLPFKPSRVESTSKHGHNKTKSDGLPPELRRLADAGSEARPWSAGGGGIQPVFLGFSRPVTASSLAVAVTQAADNAALGRPTAIDTLPHAPSRSRLQTVSNTATTFIPARSKPPKARYVDIFQITAQSRALGNKYNEDVASRNLDLRQVAVGTVEDGYDSTSRYQEEVAIRNASIELPRTSADASRNSHDETRESYETAPEATHHAYVHNGANGDDFAAGTGESEDRQQSRHQMYSMPSKTFISQLLAIPQQSPEETDGDMKPWSGERQSQETRPRAPKEPSSQRNRSRSPVRTVSGHKEAYSKSRNRLGDLPGNFATQFNTGRRLMNGPGRGHNISATSMPLYRLSPAELTPSRSHVIRSNSARSPSMNDSRMPIATQSSVPDGNSAYSSSIRSRTSSLKKSVNLSNRTIMDLTGDDNEIFSDTGRPESYTESPVLHQAEFKPLVVAQPAIITTPVEREPKGMIDSYVGTPEEPSEELKANTSSNVSANEMQPELIMPEEHKSKTGENDASSQTGSVTPQASPPKITFSKINTVASMSPRSSFIASNLPSTLNAALPDAIEGVLQRSNALPGTPAETPDVPQKPTVSAMTADEEDAEESAPVPYVHASLSPTINGVATSRSRNIKTLPPLSEDVSELPTSIAGPSQRTTTQHISPPVLQASPKSLRSTDFVHPSGTFGVHTRDFAAIPKSSALSQQAEAATSRPNSRSSSRPTSRARTAQHVGFASNGISSRSKLRPATAPVPAPISAPPYNFDEEDFARKQVAAKAALLRLKQSLEDDGAAPEEPAAPPNTTKYRIPPAVRRHHAPTSIYTARPKQLPDKPEQHSQQQYSSASYHTQVTAPSPAASTHSSSPRMGNGNWYSNRDSLDSSDENYYDAVASSFAYTHHPSSGAGTYIQHLRTYDDIHTKAPASPGDVSLSSFPLNLPVHSPNPGQAMPREQHAQQPSRRNSHVSQQSMSSTASAFSIPYHMVPGRTSSLRNFDDGFSLDGDREREGD